MSVEPKRFSIKTTGLTGCVKAPTTEPMMAFGVILTLFEKIGWRIPTPLREVKISGIGVLDGQVRVTLRRQLSPVLRGDLGMISIKSDQPFDKTFTLKPLIPAKYIDMEFQALANGFKNPQICWSF
jgi:hypothetical protein